MPSPASSQKGASPKATTPEPSDASSKPVWASGPEQITVELLFAGLYSIDVDIAKRMNIIHELRVSKDLVTVTACSAKDFEEALTFCANDRECAQPPTPTLARIQSEMDPTPAAPIKTRKTRASIGRVVHDESDTEDASYVPSDSEDDTEEEDEDDDDEEEDIKEEDVGAELEDLRAERQEHGEASSPTTAGVAKRLGNLQIAKDDEDEDEEEHYDEEGSEGEWGDEEEAVAAKKPSGKTEEEKVAEAAEIGYKVLGPLGADEKPFKPYEPVFAVVQIGSHQFKVSNGDSIFTERLKFCDVNDKLVLNRVLMLGSQTQTVIGRPILPDAAVHAVVEEHALDAKVIIFKKKRRKNYRRTKGHRQELTKLRITNIEGIDKPETAAVAA